MCHESQLPAPGEYVISYIGEDQIIVVRDGVFVEHRRQIAELATGRGHLVGQVEKLRQLGARSSRDLRNLLPIADNDEDELERRDKQFGLVTMCAAGGMAPAIIIERI